MTKKIQKTILLLCCFLALNIFWITSALGIGQITKPIIIENALRGNEFTAVLSIFNSEENEEILSLKASGEIENWTSFYETKDEEFRNPVNEIPVPPKSYLDVMAKFNIPSDIPNGKYSGKISVISGFADSSKDKTESEVRVQQKIDREVQIIVTDEEIILIKSLVVPMDYDLEENETLEIKVTYENQGNVSIRPDFQLKISKNNEDIFNAIFPYSENEEAIKPGARKIMPLFQWQTTGQKNGEYKAEVKIIVKGNIVKEENFKFRIGAKTENNILFSYVRKIGGGNLVFGWFIIGLFFVLLSIVIRFRKKKISLKSN